MYIYIYIYTTETYTHAQTFYIYIYIYIYGKIFFHKDPKTPSPLGLRFVLRVSLFLAHFPRVSTSTARKDMFSRRFARCACRTLLVLLLFGLVSSISGALGCSKGSRSSCPLPPTTQSNYDYKVYLSSRNGLGGRQLRVGDVLPSRESHWRRYPSENMQK